MKRFSNDGIEDGNGLDEHLKFFFTLYPFILKLVAHIHNTSRSSRTFLMSFIGHGRLLQSQYSVGKSP